MPPHSVLTVDGPRAAGVADPDARGPPTPFVQYPPLPGALENDDEQQEPFISTGPLTHHSIAMMFENMRRSLLADIRLTMRENLQNSRQADISCKITGKHQEEDRIMKRQASKASFMSDTEDDLDIASVPTVPRRNLKNRASTILAGSATEFTRLFEMVDKDGNGELQKADFIRAFKINKEVQTFCKSQSCLAPLLDPLMFKATFESIDVDGSDTISLKELIASCTAATDEEVNDIDGDYVSPADNDAQVALKKMFGCVDMDGSGVIKKDDLVRAMRTNSVVVSTCRNNAELTPLLNPVIFKHAFAQVPGYEGTFITYENLQMALDIIHKRSPNPPTSEPASMLHESGGELVAHEEEEEGMAYRVSNGGAFASLGGIKATSVDEEVYDVANFYWETGISQIIARSDAFIYVTLAIISLNAVYLGINADHNKADLLLDADIGFIICENLFCVFFTFELAIRFLAFEQKMNCFKDGWFKFDSFLVFLMIAETWFMPFIPTGSSAPPPTGPIRLLRLLRLSRLVRLLRSLPDLVVIVKGMYSAFRAVGSSLLMICMLIYLFAIIMHMLLAEDEATASHFETLPRCMWTLLMDGTFLNDVGGVMGKLIHRGEPNCVVASILFMIFVLLAALTVMNMLIGILCEVVSGVAASEKEEAAGRVMRETILLELKKFDDGDGMIDEDEVNDLMADPRSIEVLDALGIDISFLQGLQVMTYEEPGASFPMKVIIEQMLSCRGDLTCTVAHMVMQQKVNDWKLCNSIIQHEERMERKLDACFATQAKGRKSSKPRVGWA